MNCTTMPKLKVRYKAIPSHLATVYEVIGGDARFYVVEDPGSADGIRALEIKDCEVVQEKEWQDVTRSCHATRGTLVYEHSGGISPLLYLVDGFRFRKHHFESCRGIHPYMTAFLIEKET